MVLAVTHYWTSVGRQTRRSTRLTTPGQGQTFISKLQPPWPLWGGEPWPASRGRPGGLQGRAANPLGGHPSKLGGGDRGGQREPLAEFAPELAQQRELLLCLDSLYDDRHTERETE